MIYYSQIENLPADHPLVKAFDAQLAAEEKMWEGVDMSSTSTGDDEESYDYFNHYIAGDRR